MNYGFKNKVNNRIKHLKRNGIQFVSGTIAPAESDIETNDIESLDKALDYFYGKNEKIELFIQPKWMGSRCQIYLHRDNPELNFAVTRNGFRVKLHLAEVYGKLMRIFDELPKSSSRATRVIFDGELLPWSAIGSGLIDREFRGLIHSVETENNFLLENGYREAIQLTKNEDSYNPYMESRDSLEKKELIKRFPRQETYANLEHIEGHDTEEEFNDLAAYSKQLDIYATERDIEYKPFDILRVDYEDGSFNVDDGWMGVVSWKYWTLLDTLGTDDSLESGLLVLNENRDMVRQYFKELTENGYEGICIKPNFPKNTDAVHCMKVRNKEYLRIIYGYDYQRPENLTELVQRKRVGKKRKLSHNEYRLGLEMLKLDVNDAEYDQKYDAIAKALLFDIEQEETLDKRL